MVLACKLETKGHGRPGFSPSWAGHDAAAPALKAKRPAPLVGLRGFNRYKEKHWCGAV